MTKATAITTSRWFWVGLLLALVAVSGGASAGDILCLESNGREFWCV